MSRSKAVLDVSYLYRIFNALFLLYSIVQIFEVRESLLPSNDQAGGVTDVPVHVLTTIIPIVVSVAEIAYIALGWQIWREFGWKVYKQLGADRQIKRMYARYQIFVGIMKFDVFFFIAFSVQILGLILQSKDWEFYITCAALPLSFLLLLDGMVAARLESKNMMWSFMLGCFTGMVYFVYKVSYLTISFTLTDKRFAVISTFSNAIDYRRCIQDADLLRCVNNISTKMRRSFCATRYYFNHSTAYNFCYGSYCYA